MNASEMSHEQAKREMLRRLLRLPVTGHPIHDAGLMQDLAEQVKEIALAVRHNYYADYPDDIETDLIQLCLDAAAIGRRSR